MVSLGVCLRNLLYELSEDIDSESLKNMIFLLKESLPKVEMPVSGPLLICIGEDAFNLSW